MLTINHAELAASCQVDITHVVDMWATFRQHVGDIRIAGFDGTGFDRDLRMPASAIAEAVRMHLQAEIDDLTRKIGDLGITPDTIVLASMPAEDKSATPANDVAGAW